jgi:hypothetical protein
MGGGVGGGGVGGGLLADRRRRTSSPRPPAAATAASFHRARADEFERLGVTVVKLEPTYPLSQRRRPNLSPAAPSQDCGLFRMARPTRDANINGEMSKHLGKSQMQLVTEHRVSETSASKKLVSFLPRALSDGFETAALPTV